ncbi:FliH/SctL family protein [Acidisphaera sp. L21]|uniref:FliH/SctL family protein n=1 Tax=Acidisphaera sp. L21 TaxID=1641851 RepID=UPI00131ACE43|nr:FliH/SctL family protein [Acidisphaera sp. L21]
MSDYRSSHRPNLLGVLYAEDFDDDGTGRVQDEPESGPEPEIIEPTFSVAEMEAARAEARAEGRAEMERSLAATRTHMLGLLATGMADGRAGAHAAALETADAVVKCMMSMMVTCLPALCERFGDAEVQALCRTILPGLVDEAKIVVRINPEMMGTMEAELAELDFELAERIHLLPTEAMQQGDVRISWGDGSVIRDARRARRLVEDALAQMGLLQQEMADA